MPMVIAMKYFYISFRPANSHSFRVRLKLLSHPISGFRVRKSEKIAPNSTTFFYESLNKILKKLPHFQFHSIALLACLDKLCWVGMGGNLPHPTKLGLISLIIAGCLTWLSITLPNTVSLIVQLCLQMAV